MTPRRANLPRAARYLHTSRPLSTPEQTGELSMPMPRCDTPLDDGGRCARVAGHLGEHGVQS